MYVWKLDGIYVNDQMTVKNDGLVTMIHGLAHRYRGGGCDHYSWRAQISPQGWIVETTSSSSRVEQFAGATFNMIVEVATAIGRAL